MRSDSSRGFALATGHRSRGAVVLVLGAACAALHTGDARAADPTARGPFAVGFTSFVERDGRALDGVVYRKHQNGRDPRPVPMMVFYPVDAPDAAGAPTAAYPANPFAGPQPAFTSAAFEAQGVDPAFHEPKASSAGPFPLAVLTTGARAPYWFHVGLATRLASHGFVVVLLAHYGENAYGNAAGSPIDPRTLGDNTPLQRGLNRLYDTHLAIDAMLARSATAGDRFEGRVDPGRIAAGGHSIGGLTALQLTGGDDDLCNTYGGGAGDGVPASDLPPCSSGVVVPAIHEPRIQALLLLDPSVQLLHWNELHRVTVPAIVVGEDADSLAANAPQFPPWIGGWAHQALSGVPSYLASVAHTAHVPSFTSACAAALVRGNPTQFHNTRCDDPTLTPYQAANELVWRYAVAFLQTELAGVRGSQPLLTPGWAVAHEPFATFHVNELKNGLEPPAPFGDPSFVQDNQPDPHLGEHPVWLDE